MSWRISAVLFLFVLVSCTKKKEVAIKDDRTPFLISTEELLEIHQRESIKIFDFRKKEAYENGHIIDAIQIWRDDIVDDNYPYGGMMAKPEQMEELLSRLGIQSTDTLVIYDDKGLCEAARLWWILQNYNFDKVRLMEGGITKWKELGGKVSQDLPLLTKTNFKFTEKPSMKYYVGKEEVLSGINDHILIDTRSLDEYTGKEHKKGAAKAGHIPNSKHMDWAEAIDYHGDQSFKSITELENIYKKLNINKTDPIIVYCHSGVRSAHTTFVLTQLLDYKNVKNYDGSWTEWSHFEELPYKNKSVIN